MNLLGSAYELVLCGGLLWLAWWTVTAAGLFRSVVMFMAFGLLLAVTWAWLGSSDLALAEAIIGAGITGALLLKSCTAASTDDGSLAAATRPEPSAGLPRPLLAGFCAVLGIGLALVTEQAMEDPATATATATARLAHEAHVLRNPVTAVLLDFRGYDTLLEMVVLLAAFLGSRSLLDQIDLPPLYASTDRSMPMLVPLVAMVTPLLLLTAIFLYWAGSHRTGGAFQAGSLLAALGVLYRLAGRLESRSETSLLSRGLLVLGLLVFGGFSCLALWWAPAPLSFPAQDGYVLVIALTIEFALMISIAVTLTLLFAATPGLRLTGRQP